jgi:hypothetical protein
VRPRFFVGLFPLIYLIGSIAFPAFSQISEVLNNTGDPLRVAYACAEEDLQRAGMDCTEDRPCPVYLELTATARNGAKIFAAGNLHTSSATLVSVLLMSADNGSTWKEPVARIAGAAIDQLQFYDLQHAWAAGETQDPLPRDPFFLVSTSGGDSWRKRPVSEDGAPGSIQSFHFDSPQHGTLIIDVGKSAPSGRYVSYESQTGGESWMIRGTSGALPRSSPESSDLRIQAVQDGKVWQIQQRSGEQWSPVASFLVEPVTCGRKPQQ